MEIGVARARVQLSELIRRAASGEEVTITRRGKPVARLVPLERPSRRVLGQDEGRYVVPEDFDAPMVMGFE